MADTELIRDTKGAEGCKLIAYLDTLGNWTVGYGHLLAAGVDWSGHEITQATADQLLSLDLDSRAAQAATLPEWSALDTPCRRNAVIECVFNLGFGHWQREFPATRAAIRGQRWMDAAKNLLNSPEWVMQVGLPRVSRLAAYLQNGSYTPQPA